MLLVDGGIIDSVMMMCVLTFNGCMIVVFVAPTQRRDGLVSARGYVVNLLLVSFTMLWVLNLLSGRGIGRLVTGAPIMLFLVDDLYYRTLQRKKPKHHPFRWPVHLYFYVILYFVGVMLLGGYGFLVSLFNGFLVIASFYGRLAAYGYYQYRHKKA